MYSQGCSLHHGMQTGRESRKNRLFSYISFFFPSFLPFLLLSLFFFNFLSDHIATAIHETFVTSNFDTIPHLMRRTKKLTSFVSARLSDLHLSAVYASRIKRHHLWRRKKLSAAPKEPRSRPLLKWDLKIYLNIVLNIDRLSSNSVSGFN